MYGGAIRNKREDVLIIVEESEYLNHVVISDSKSAIQAIGKCNSGNIVVQEILNE